MSNIARNAGRFFLLSYLAAVVISGLIAYLEGAAYTEAVTSLFFYALAILGAAMFLASFFLGARDRDGNRPTFGTLAFFWLGLSILVIVSAAGYILLELALPDLLPSLPEWIVLGVRNAAFVVVFEVGWGVFFGMRRGFITEESDPFPLGFLFRRSSGVRVEDRENGGD